MPRYSVSVSKCVKIMEGNMLHLGHTHQQNVSLVVIKHKALNGQNVGQPSRTLLQI